MTQPTRSADPSPLESPILHRAGVSHGFGVCGATPPPNTLCPEQVHGVAVAEIDDAGALVPRQADAVVSNRSSQFIGIVTADCVPILAASDDGSAVVAIHAGWRGLAAGVVEAGIEALRAVAPPKGNLIAAIGPHIGICCYEVDAPVLRALAERFGDAKVQQCQRATRPGHARIELSRLVAHELLDAGIAADRLARLEDSCTACHPERFESFRRDGDVSGRLVHYIAAR